MSIDLNRLPSPAVVQQATYDAVRDAMLADLQARDPSLHLLPSDPAYKVIEVAAYREFLMRQEFNDRARSLMLAYAAGSDLDHLGVTYFRTQRLVIDEGDPNAVPPVPPTYESDAAYRRRLLLAEDGYSTAGPAAAYVYHAMSASGEVKDIAVSSPSPGQVVIAVLGHAGDGTPDAALIDAVEAALGDQVRPMTDEVLVQAATVFPFTVAAELTVYPGFNEGYVRSVAEEALLAWVATQHRIGRDIAVTGLIAALHVEGVHDVTLVDRGNGTDLVSNLIVTDTQAAYCTGVSVTVGGTDG